MTRPQEKKREVRSKVREPSSCHVRDSEHSERRQGDKEKGMEKEKMAAKVGKQVGSGLHKFLAGSNWSYCKEDKKVNLIQFKPGTPNASPKVKAPAPKKTPRLKRLEGERPPAADGFAPEEIADAVDVLKAPDELCRVREAVGFLREVTGEGSEESSKKLLNLYAIMPLLQLLEHPDAAVVEDAVMCFRNMLTRHARLRNVITNEGILLPFIRVLKETQIESIKANVISVLPYLARGKTDAITLRSSGAIPALIDMLRIDNGAPSHETRGSFGRYPLDSPAISLSSPAGFGIIGFPSFASTATESDSPRSTLASPHTTSLSANPSFNSGGAAFGSLPGVSELDIPEAASRAFSDEVESHERLGSGSAGSLSSSGGLSVRGGRRADRLQAVPEAEAEVHLSLEQQCWEILNSSPVPPESPAEEPPTSTVCTSMPRRIDLTIDPGEGRSQRRSDSVRVPAEAHKAQATTMPLYEDACVALSLLAKFEAVCLTILDKGGLRHLVSLANSAEGEGLQEPIVSILHQVAKVQGGANALCFEDGGGGLLVLTKYARGCDGVVKRKALDGLADCAAASPECRQLVQNLNVLDEAAKVRAGQGCGTSP